MTSSLLWPDRMLGPCRIDDRDRDRSRLVGSFAQVNLVVTISIDTGGIGLLSGCPSSLRFGKLRKRCRSRRRLENPDGNPVPSGDRP